jgi:hypothetical protein
MASKGKIPICNVMSRKIKGICFWSQFLSRNHAGISESALRHLEGGKGATVKTLIRVIRALDREGWLTGISPQVSINPLHMVREKQPRQRASRRTHGKKEKN